MWASGGAHSKASRTGQRSLESHTLDRPGILLEHDITIWPQPSFLVILKPSRLHPGSTQCSPALFQLSLCIFFPFGFYSQPVSSALGTRAVVYTTVRRCCCFYSSSAYHHVMRWMWLLPQVRVPCNVHVQPQHFLFGEPGRLQRHELHCGR